MVDDKRPQEERKMKNITAITKLPAIALTAALAISALPFTALKSNAATVSPKAATQTISDANMNEFKNYYDSSSAFLAIHGDELADDVRIALDTARSQAYNALVSDSGYLEAMSGLRIQLSYAQASLAGTRADTNAAPAPVIGTAAANLAGIGTNNVSAATANRVATIYSTNRNLPASMIKTRLLNDFVERLYSYVFGRPCDQAGRDAYVNAMINGDMTANDVVNNMLNSSEFASRNLSDEAFMTVIYQALLDRTPDASGLNNWVNALKTGTSRASVISYFESTDNWNGLCTFYGIN